MRRASALLLLLLPALWAASPVNAAQSDEPDLALLRSSLIPKREVGADAFLKALPTADGRGVLIGVFDTGVDPGAAGLSVTTTGERKIVDLLDATGSGDVDMRTRRRPDGSGRLNGLSGRRLTLPEGIVNPGGEVHVGLKPAAELFYGSVLRRVDERRRAMRAAEASQQAAARAASADGAALQAALAKAAEDRLRAERDRVARHMALAALEQGKTAPDAGALFDCVLWHDGHGWRVVVDTDEDGDLRNERVLQPFGVAGEFASFGELPFTNFAVQVYDQGRLLSIVTVSGDHGTHVASIAAGHEPSERARDGIAPGARLLSVKIGDSRLGGSADQGAFLRAAALLARHKADIVNVSYGSRSLLQDGRNATSRIHDALVERHDILVVMSAGNEGPALGTAGMPGAEARRVLGVGAYLSPEMGATLYGTLQAARGGALPFSSRGPTKDGDFGVDLMAPGAAIASVSHETLQGSGRKNGTSMASPSAAGVAALVLGAARQARLDATPARLRAALMLGATALPQEEAWTRGGGLVNAPGAWKKLQELQREPAFAAFYDLQVDSGSFTHRGRGLLWREALAAGRRRVAVRITPAWAESVPAAQRVAFGADLRLRPSVPWINASKTLHLTSGTGTAALEIDPPPLPAGAIGAVRTAQVDALLVGRPALGPVFSVPVTLVQPAPATAFRQHRLETMVELEPGRPQRHFVQAPPNADRLRIHVRHRARDTLARSLRLHAVAYAAQTHVAAMEAERQLTLEPGQQASLTLALNPGSVAEVAYTQGFAGAGGGALDVQLEWLGTGLSAAPAILTANSGGSLIGLTPYADLFVRVEARLEQAVHVFLPERSTRVPMDERAEWPASPATPGPRRLQVLRQRFAVTLKSPLTVQVQTPSLSELGDSAGASRVTLVHESGQLLHDGGASFGTGSRTARTITLPKGRTLVLRDLSALEPELLDTLTHLPLRLAEPLKTPRTLPVRASARDRFSSRPITELKLVGGREELIHVQDGAADETARHEPRPAHMQGQLSLRDGDNQEVGHQPLLVLPGASPTRTTNADARPLSPADARSELEKLADSVYESRLAFVRAQRGQSQAAIAARRLELLAALRAERPHDGQPVFEQALDVAIAAGLASPGIWPRKSAQVGQATTAAAAAASASATAATSPVAPAPERAASEVAAAPARSALAPDLGQAAVVLALLDEVRRLAGPEAVAQYFGAIPATTADDAAARSAHEAEKKRLTLRRELLARSERLRSDVHRATGAWDLAWTALAETRRWEPPPGDKATGALEALLHEQSGHLGLALQALEAQLKDDPTDLKLLQQRAALYRKLGWARFADAEDLRLTLQALRRMALSRW